jgi:cyanate permease
MFFLPAISIAEEISRTGHMSSVLNLAFLLAFEVVIAVAYLLKSRRAQEWITAQAMFMTLVYVGLLFWRLPS